MVKLSLPIILLGIIVIEQLVVIIMLIVMNLSSVRWQDTVRIPSTGINR